VCIGSKDLSNHVVSSELCREFFPSFRFSLALDLGLIFCLSLCNRHAGAGKRKIVCLHGYMQSADILRFKMGSWRKALRARFELVFVDAPFLILDSENAEIAKRLAESQLEHRSWCGSCHCTPRSAQQQLSSRWHVHVLHALYTTTHALKSL
jgi:hypothetical protein